LANLGCLDSLLSLTPITLSGPVDAKILTHTHRGTTWLLACIVQGAVLGQPVAVSQPLVSTQSTFVSEQVLLSFFIPNPHSLRLQQHSRHAANNHE
jgi:hypothetical protein